MATPQWQPRIGKILWGQRSPASDDRGYLSKPFGRLIVYVPVYIYYPMLEPNSNNKRYYIKLIEERLEDLIQKTYKPKDADIVVMTGNCNIDDYIREDIDHKTGAIKGYYTDVALDIHRWTSGPL